MPESGALDLVGITLEATFLGDTLDRLGIVGEFERIAEYKSAIEPFTRDAMSEPMREALNAVLDSVFDDLVGEIAASRGLDPDTVRRLIDQAPLSARAAAEAGLIDAVLFEDELPAYLADGPRGHPAIVPWAGGAAAAPPAVPVAGAGARAIAVIALRGPIVMGESRGRPPLAVPLLGGETTGHATVARAVRAVERNPLFGALVLSVDSPGGSALASDLIWREIERVGHRKPVVAFFGNVAASGGYYVAASARRIVCLPGTLTGSIGIIAGKFNVRGLLERLGAHREILARGDAATIASPFVPFSADERRRLRAQTEETYARFVDRVARGRHMPPDAVRAVARGRVWTGRQAKERGSRGRARRLSRRARRGEGPDGRRARAHGVRSCTSGRREARRARPSTRSRRSARWRREPARSSRNVCSRSSRGRCRCGERTARGARHDPRERQRRQRHAPRGGPPPSPRRRGAVRGGARARPRPRRGGGGRRSRRSC